MVFREYPDIVDVPTTQKMLSISRHVAYDLILSGGVAGVKIGRAYRIPKVSIIDHVTKNA